VKNVCINFTSNSVCINKFAIGRYVIETGFSTETEVRAERLGFDSWWRQEVFLFATASRPAVEPFQPPIQWIQGAPSPEIKRQGSETDHSPPFSADVKNAWS